MDELIDLIYEAAVIPERWPLVLTKLAQLVDGVGGVLFTGDLGKWVASPDAVGVVQDYLDQGWHNRTTRTQRLFERGTQYPGFVCDLDVFSPEEIEQEPVYAEFFRPRGWGWGAGTIIAAPSGDLLAVDIERPYERGPIESQVVRRLDELRPHLARAALLSGRLALERMRSATEVLDMVGLASAVLGAGGRPLVMNGSCEQLLDDLLVIRGGRIAVTQPLADQLLKDALVGVGVFGASTATRSIPVSATEKHPPIIMHILPVRGAAHDIFSGAAALLIVTPMAAKASPPVELLQGLFDLTPAEARIARAIAQRRTINEIAQSLGLSRETIRTQVKSVLSKTGQSRQLDLAVMLTVPFEPRT